MKNRVFLLSGLVLGLLTACGPMNKAPAGFSPSGSGGTINPAGATQITQKSMFVVYVVNETTKTSKKPPDTGENIYRVRGIAAKELQPMPPNAKLTFIYWMPEMPDMGKFEEAGQKQADGSYTASIVYSMRGHWEVTIKIQDGADQDQYVFDVNI